MTSLLYHIYDMLVMDWGIEGTRDDFNRLFDMVGLGEKDVFKFEALDDNTFAISIKRENGQREVIYDSYQLPWLR